MVALFNAVTLLGWLIQQAQHLQLFVEILQLETAASQVLSKFLLVIKE